MFREGVFRILCRLQLLRMEGKDDPGISDDPLNEPTNDDPDHPVD